ncbi:hypothetical protein [Nocardioides donggukensis]|uniref:Uncharacterized protein n=1 Tax=Nocardioides donggukensis TaxID=2774019 RepID=A0A927K553_9ACTN|nr:hypothetical protein [Nocardioides donggukensis]MBD8870927.1 hypothetical protein [Nocardioides donggukensis]
MPAPHRRNHGETLAKKIDNNASNRGLDDRDNLVASRTRHAKKWEETASTLDRATRAVSDLEQRAKQTRTDFERAGHLSRFSNDVRQHRARLPIVVLRPESPARYWLGYCLRCDLEMWVHRPKPRVPICGRCRHVS